MMETILFLMEKILQLFSAYPIVCFFLVFVMVKNPHLPAVFWGTKKAGFHQPKAEASVFDRVLESTIGGINGASNVLGQ